MWFIICIYFNTYFSGKNKIQLNFIKKKFGLKLFELFESLQ